MTRGPYITKLGDRTSHPVTVQHRDMVFEDDRRRIEHHGPDRNPKSCSVFLWQNMVSELTYASHQSPAALQVAILVGHVVESSVGDAIEVRGYVGLDQYKDLWEFTDELAGSWDLTLNRIRRLSDGYYPLGWCVVDPSSDAEMLTQQERLTHRTFFNLPFQVTLRLNPGAEDVSIFGFDENGSLIQTGFHVVHQRSSGL